MIKNIKTNKKDIYFIATKYKNEPAKVNFYTKGGKLVSNDRVSKNYSGEARISNNYYSFQ